jgi:Skp family chaperone for outer membrane proteins
MARGVRLLGYIGLTGLLVGQSAVAQETTAPGTAQAVSNQQVIEVPSPILTLDWEELYARSAWGQRVAAEIEATSIDLNTENTRIADDLVAEEKALTTRRAGMPASAFRAEADAFDARVVGIRRAQEIKARSIAARSDSERSKFIENAMQLLDPMIEARGAVVVIDRRVIIRGAGAVDVTADLIERADAAFGDGAALSASDPAAEPTLAPQTAPAPSSDATATTP